MSGDSLGDLIATLGSIDDDEIDWPNVQRTTVLIHQTFHYAYPAAITALRQRLIVVPPDFHDDQRLVTYKTRVSGCNVDTERSYDTFGNVVLDFSVEGVEHDVEFSTWVVVEREAAGEPDEALPDARFLEPSRLTFPDDALREAAEPLRRQVRRASSSQPRSRASCTTTSRTTGASRASRRRPRRPGAARSASARTTRTAWSRSAACAGSRRATSRATCWARAARTRGSRCWCRTRATRSALGGRVRPDARRVPGCATCRWRWGATTATSPPTSGTFEGPFGGELTTHKRAAVTRVEYLRPRRRRRSGPVRVT